MRSSFMCLALTALLGNPSLASSKVIALFPGTSYIFPISLTDEPCTRSAANERRAVMHAITKFNPAGDNLEACWYFTNMGKDHLPKNVVATCLRERGLPNGRVSNDCRWIDKDRFLDPATVPRSAF